MTENKIKLYDYYLKFPCTMLSDDFQKLKEHWNFDEYDAFFIGNQILLDIGKV